MSQDVNYRRTEAGEEALRSEDTAIPVDYRRILAHIEGDTHINVIRGRLRRFPDPMISSWLAELEELGFIEVSSTSAHFDLDFEPVAQDAGVEISGELQQIAEEARAAAAALHGKGAYLAMARLQNRARAAKAPSAMTVLVV